MDVSVIVLTYNQEETINTALDSILNQETDLNYEIILADDCSTDNTPMICREYEKLYPEKIKFIARKANLGLVKNYFDCFSKCKGRYIADCAGDDIWLGTDRLQRQFDIIDGQSDISMVSGQWICYDESSNKSFQVPNITHPGVYQGKGFMLDLLTGKKVINLSSSLYRKEIITDFLQRDPGILKGDDNVIEDLQIVLACLEKGKIIVTADFVFQYFVGHTSVSNQNSFAKRFQFSSKALFQKIRLQKYFLPHLNSRQTQLFSEHIKRRGDYLMSLVFKAGPQNYNLVKSVLPKLNYGFKGMIYSFVFKMPFCWNMILKIYSKLAPQKFSI